jgi:hypothetical protein
MPNWTLNTIRADGPEADLRTFLDAIKGDKDPIDFERIIPMPPLLRHTASGSHEFDGLKVSTWFVENPDAPFNERRQRAFTPEEEAALKDLGFTDWYHWSVHHWGTKWNACHPEIIEGDAAAGYVEIRFDTAWGPPMPVFQKLIELFPQLTLNFDWIDECETVIWSLESPAQEADQTDELPLETPSQPSEDPLQPARSKP